ncbi:hypothetical protein H2200_010281 [Cladophialophora chaetospira]|uniref:Amidohydrolase-related domain-containing protein n=1 Tax=Cladophialophora chaetospira TaxID=386627 RepID=A0AA38X1B8_9EURO|nr:hypothetical protein H2200_010281 [Cladophialophora chaetospira]
MASKLFTGGTIISYSPSSHSLQPIRNGSLLVTNGKIAEIYSEPPPKADLPKDTEVIDVTGKIITPGFIDTHRHGWQTAFKTLGPNTTLAAYFQQFGQFVPAVAENFTSEDLYLGQLAGLYEALNAGVTSTVDHAHGHWRREDVDEEIKACVESGARVFYGYTFHSTPKGWPIEEQFEHFKGKIQEFRGNDGLVSLGISYDGFAMGTPDIDKQVVDVAQYVYDVPDLPLIGWSLDIPTLVDQAGLLRSEIPVIFSHSSFITAEDIDLLRETNQYISTTPESEFHYGHDNPGAELCQDQASLGVDTHFTFSTDILTQARLWLQHLRAANFRKTLETQKIPIENPMSVSQAFLLATRAGGLALRRPDLGVIQKNATADLCFFDGNSPSLLGWYDPVAAVILHAHVGDISDVIVNGEFVKRDGKIIAPGYDSIKERFLKSARKIQEVWTRIGDPKMTLGEDKFLGFLEYGEVQKVVSQRKE